ncbi:aldehyde dehydrogenase [Micromonospora cremea]|nr:aldehyde dehydrogenase [Micromonospora cremea]
MRIGGEWRPAIRQFDSIDPFTGQPWASVPEATEADVDDAVAAARVAFDDGRWSRLPGAERGEALRRLADLILESADELALSEVRDNGKLLREMRDQVRSLPAHYRYFAGLADKIDGRVVDTGRDNYFGMVLREPIGVVAAILPWNSPLLLLTFKLAPALAAGCTVVVKPSEQAPVSILKFAELVDKAGIPAGVFNTVAGSGKDVGQWLVSNPGIDKVSFTGSGVTGAAIAAQAATHLAPTALELGAKSANIVFDDCEVDAAVNGLLAGIFAAAGQSCIAGSRALVQRGVADEVTAKLTERTRKIRLGDPRLTETEMGPIAFPAQRDKVASFVEQARVDGATVVTGGRTTGEIEQFYEPTILSNLPTTSRVWREEIFGPVLAVTVFDTEEDAVALANATDYGLAAGVWTTDVRRALRLARRLVAGTIWINAYRTLNYAMPFGGLKRSGYGRENGVEAMHEYLTDKAVWIELTGATRDPFTIG